MTAHRHTARMKRSLGTIIAAIMLMIQCLDMPSFRPLNWSDGILSFYSRTDVTLFRWCVAMRRVSSSFGRSIAGEKIESLNYFIEARIHDPATVMQHQQSNTHTKSRFWCETCQFLCHLRSWINLLHFCHSTESRFSNEEIYFLYNPFIDICTLRQQYMHEWNGRKGISHSHSSTRYGIWSIDSILIANGMHNLLHLRRNNGPFEYHSIAIFVSSNSSEYATVRARTDANAIHACKQAIATRLPFDMNFKFSILPHILLVVHRTMDYKLPRFVVIWIILNIYWFSCYFKCFFLQPIKMTKRIFVVNLLHLMMFSSRNRYLHLLCDTHDVACMLHITTRIKHAQFMPLHFVYCDPMQWLMMLDSLWFVLSTLQASQYRDSAVDSACLGPAPDRRSDNITQRIILLINW